MASTLTDDDVRHVAKLARLRLDEDELRDAKVQLERVLAHAAELEAIDTTDVTPTFHTVDAARLRADELTTGPSREDLLEGAPKIVDQGFAVPKVLE